MPGREQIGDALHAFVAQLRRKPWGLTACESVDGHRAGNVFAVANRFLSPTAFADIDGDSTHADGIPLLINGGDGILLHPEDAAVVVAILRGDAEPAGSAARNGQRPSPNERIFGIGGEGRCSQGSESECD